MRRAGPCALEADKRRVALETSSITKGSVIGQGVGPAAGIASGVLRWPLCPESVDRSPHPTPPEVCWFARDRLHRHIPSPSPPMASAAVGAWRALNALYDGAPPASTLRHWHSPRQVSSAKSSLRDPLLPSTRIAVGVSDPFVVVLNSRQGSSSTRWNARRIVRASSSSSAVPEPAPPGTGFFQKLAQARNSAGAPTLRASDIFWPSAGAFVAMAGFGYLDDILAARGLKFTMASFGAVSALLFTSPKAPASQKYAVFVAHLACALLGVAALAVFGPGFLSRSFAVAASIAFMQMTGSFHPPAAAIPLIFIDNPKFHHLTWWYILFPGAAGCFLLFLLQEGVLYLKEKWKFG